MSKHKAFKLNEFNAHSGKVEALRIGRKSGRVLATGGEDKKVNVWAIGKQNAVMSLAGHTSAVESVAFDAGEEIIVAGSAGGTVKMWDLEAKKVIRTLNGHKANCVTVDFHPYGEFFASGSIDTQLKIWDIRRKGCIQTYKGHTKGVRLARFSPDGRWVVSGGEDGAIKIWDLTAGKLLHDFQARPSPVVCIDFHPHEFLLASGSADGVVTFWDLETFEQISTTPDYNNGSVGSITFTPSGLSLLSSYQNSLCVWGWEPKPACLDTVVADWNGVMDMTIVNDQLIACSVQGEQVGTWMVNMQKLTLNPPSNSEKGPHKIKTQRPDTSMQDYKVNSVRNVIKAGDSGLGSQFRAFDIPATPDDDAPESKPAPSFPTHTPSPSHSPSPSPSPSSAPPVSHAAPSSVPKTKAPKQTTPQPQHHPAADKGFGIDVTPFTQKSSLYESDSEAGVMSHVADHHNTLAAALGKRLQHFKHAKVSWSENGSGADNKGILTVVGTIGDMEDAAVTVEVLRMLPHREDYLTLDLCTALLPLMGDLLNFTHEDYQLQALAWTSRLVKAFGHVIKTTREAPMAKGVDISKEERLEKCQTCHTNLVSIQQLVTPLTRRSGSVGSNAKDLASLLKIYVSEV